MMKRSVGQLGIVVVLGWGLAACMGGGSQQGAAGSSTSSSVFSGWFSAPKPAPAPQAAAVEEPDVPCPKVEVREGGSTLREGKGADVRVQFSIRDVARECSAGKNGTTVMKIGVEGIAAIGTAGKPGAVSAPITITATKGDKVVASKTVTLKTTVPADENQAQFRLIEPNFILPAGAEEADITVGFKG